MTRAAVILGLCLALSGCDRMRQLLHVLWGVEETLVVFSPTPIAMSTVPVGLELREPIKVVGGFTQLCFPLRGDFPLAATEAMNAEFKALLGNATLEAILTTAGGAKIRLGQASQAWSKDGKVEKRDEMSACIYEAKRGQSLAKGVVISKVEVTSSMPLKVRGAYWFSTSSFDHAKKGN